MSDTVDDPRTTFLKSLPRKIVEIKATLGALIADPRSSRMRDELRRRLHALLTLARSYNLPGMAEALRSAEEILDATRPAPSINSADIDRLTSFIASLAARAERDIQNTSITATELPAVTLRGLSAPPGAPLGTLRASIPPPPGTRSDLPPNALPTIPRKAPSRPPATHTLNLPSASFSAAQCVLFVGTHVLAATLRSVLPADMELLPAETLSDALSLARDTAPDVIVAEVEPPADGPSLLTALRSDPLTDFLPVILLASSEELAEPLRARCPDAAEVLTITTDVFVLRTALERVLASSTLAPPLPDLGELTLDELSRALADEIRRGLVGAATPRSRGARLSLGSGNEVLSATWEAIARIREVLEKQSRGAVRFELTANPRGLPGTHIFSMGDGATDEDPLTPQEDPLPGRKALVVDDDPEVVKSFSALLSQAGMTVIERHDGASAMRAARGTHPDVVIADILMPGIDGFGLCRAIQRDVSLRHTPVILLSWKEDLLTRMRELGAQAQGYLRKESTGDAVLARVRAVLRARVRILRRVAEIDATGTVRGRIERVGAFPLVEEAARTLGNATITLADSSSVTELELRDGRLIAAVRTAQDGSLVRGESALLQSLGLHTGRFAVRRNSATSRANLVGEVSELLYQSARRISALEESVSGAALLDVGRVEMDPESASSYARSLTPSLRDAVHALLEGASARSLIERNLIDLPPLEALLLELVRRGAVHRVLGARGEDLGALRLATPPDEPYAATSAPATETPAISLASAPATEVAPVAVDETASAPEVTPVAVDETASAPGVTPVAVDPTSSAPETPPVAAPPPSRPSWVLPAAAALESVPPPAPSAPRAPDEFVRFKRPVAEPDTLAAAVWRELRGVVDERRPSSPDNPAVPESHVRRGFALGDFEMPSGPPRGLMDSIPPTPPVAPLAPLPSLPPMSGVPLEALSDVSLPEVKLAITDTSEALTPREPRAYSEAPPAMPPAVAPPTTLKPPPAEPEPEAVVLLSRPKAQPAGKDSAWEVDTATEESGDPSAETYEFKSFPPPPPGTRVAPIVTAIAPSEPPAPPKPEPVAAKPASEPPPVAPPEVVPAPAAATEVAPPKFIPGPPEPRRADAKPEPEAKVEPKSEPKSEPPPVPSAAAKSEPPVAAKSEPPPVPRAALKSDPPATKSEPPAPTPRARTEPRSEPPAAPSSPSHLETEPPPPPEPVRKTPHLETVPAPAPTPVGPRIEEPTKESDATVAYNPRKTLKPFSPPPDAPTLTSPTSQHSWARLGLYVVLTFAASYLAVRWYIQQQPAVAPEPVLDIPPDAQVAPTSAADASVVAPGIGPDASIDVANTARVTDDAGASPYVNPAPWLDGGTLPPRTGLLVVRAQRRGASPVEVQVDQRVIGNAPITLPLSEGLHTVRFRAGIITSYQFATLRAASAVVLDAPSDH